MNILAFPRPSIEPLIQTPFCLFFPQSTPTQANYAPRHQLENDPAYVQLIAYAVLRHPDGQVWAYRRTGGDPRLHGRHSVGVGGHVDQADVYGSVIETARAALVRELAEELVLPPPQIPQLPIGWINEQESDVGRVHIGLVWDIPWPHTEAPKPAHGEALESIGFVPPDTVTTGNGFELWSERALQLCLQIQNTTP